MWNIGQKKYTGCPNFDAQCKLAHYNCWKKFPLHGANRIGLFHWNGSFLVSTNRKDFARWEFVIWLNIIYTYLMVIGRILRVIKQKTAICIWISLCRRICSQRNFHFFFVYFHFSIKIIVYEWPIINIIRLRRSS